jgi:hypothetical protein
MDNHNRSNNGQWRILCWNVRGINSQPKLTAIRSKISEKGCDIICPKETKKGVFFTKVSLKSSVLPPSIVLSLLPRWMLQAFDCFEFTPSVGASGGAIIIWKSSCFNVHVIVHNSYAMSMELVSTFSGMAWVLTDIYAPCTTDGKMEFLNWLHNFELPEGTN